MKQSQIFFRGTLIYVGAILIASNVWPKLNGAITGSCAGSFLVAFGIWSLARPEQVKQTFWDYQPSTRSKLQIEKTPLWGFAILGGCFLLVGVGIICAAIFSPTMRAN